MPYAITGYAGGMLRQIVLQDDGTCTGDGLVVRWLKDNPPVARDKDAVVMQLQKLLHLVSSAPMSPEPEV